MFGSWAQLASPPEDLTQKARCAPPAPTVLDFPSYTPQNPTHPLTSASSQDLFRLLCSIRKPQDITPQYLQLLNLSVIPNVSFQDILSDTATSDVNDPKPLPHQDRLHETIQELRANHSDAFREIIRLPPPLGRPRIRLTRTRRFWTGLEKMSQYWDCSMDQYYEVPDIEDADDLSSSSSSSDSDTEMSNTDHQSHPLAKPPNSPPLNTTTTTTTTTTTNPPTTKQKLVYKGRRLSTGSLMPASHRDETASALVESVVWAFNCQVRPPGLSPRLSVRNLLFPVRQSFIVGRLPVEREVARRNVLEGPVMGVCSRVETSFRGSVVDGGGQGERVDGGCGWREVLDLAREVGVMLLLAQERAREGKVELGPGEGKWWTSAPRWGGGAGGAMENDTLPVTPLAAEQTSTPPENSLPNDASTTLSSAAMNPAPSSARPKRKANGDLLARDDGSGGGSGGGGGGGVQHKKGIKSTQAERWKTLRPGPGIWDQKLKYLRIGVKAPSSAATDTATENEAEDDTIFMVSAINHHVALLSAKVSPRYLKWLAGEELGQAEKQAEDQALLGLRLKRTRWFDLFKEGDRVEFVEGLWGVMGWLMRD